MIFWCVLTQIFFKPLSWHYWTSLLLVEFLTAESDWKFLLIQMFNNSKYSLDMVEIYMQKHIKNAACQMSLGWSFSWNSCLLKAVNYFCRVLHLRCLTEFWIRLWFNHKLYFEIYSRYLYHIPCVIFLCANDKLVITQFCLLQNWQKFEAPFSCFAVISQVANYKSL